MFSPSSPGHGGRAVTDSATEDTDWSKYRRRTASALADARAPDSGDERWRYTSADDFTSSADGSPPASSPLPSPLLAGEALVVDHDLLADGARRHALGLRHGLEIRTIAEAWEREPRRLARALDGSGIRDEYFVRRNTVDLTAGLVLRVPENRNDAPPLEIVWRADRAPSVLRLIVLLETGSRLTLLEQSSSGAGGLAHVVREIFLEPGARLRHLLLDTPRDRGRWLWTSGVHLLDGAVYEAIGIHAGAERARHDWHVFLRGRGSRALLHAALLLVPRTVCDLETTVRHEGHDSASRQLVHAAAAAHARAVYGGTVVVDPGTRGIDAHQQARGLLLDRASEIDARPELHIHSDDVRCTHGASVGEIDPKSLFYLESRGIDARHARALLLEAFAGRVVSEIAPPLPADLRAVLLERLATLARDLAPEGGP